MSKPSMLSSAGVRVVTMRPSRSLVPLKKLVPGDDDVASRVALRNAESPVAPRSPSSARMLTRALTVPVGGVRKPESGITSELLTAMSENPSNTVRLRSGCVGLRYTTISDHPA